MSLNRRNDPSDKDESHDPLHALRYLLNQPWAQEDEHLKHLLGAYHRTPSPHLYRSIAWRLQDLQQASRFHAKIRPVQRNDPLSQGEIQLGVDLSTQQPVTLHLNELFQHIIIVAYTGAGKTTLARLLVRQLLPLNLPLLVFQKKFNQFEHMGEASAFRPTLLHLNELRDAFFEFHALRSEQDLFRCYEIPLNIGNDQFQREDSRKFALQALPELQKMWPLTRVRKEGFPTVQDLLDAIHTIYERDVKTKNPQLYSSIVNTWELLWLKNRVFHARAGMYPTLRRRTTIVKYNHSEEDLVWILAFLQAARVIHENDRLPSGRKAPFLMLLDDAQDLVEARSHSRTPVYVSYLNISRENLCGFILAFQTATQVEPKLFSSTGTHIIGRIPNGREADRLVGMLGLDRQYAGMLTQLKPGQFLLHSPSSEGVAAFQCPPLPLETPSDFHAWEQQNEEWKRRFYFNCVRDYVPPHPPESRGDSQTMPESARRLLYEIINHPFDTLAGYRTRLAMPTASFQRAVQTLEDCRLIRRRSISKCKALELLPAGAEWAGVTPMIYHGKFPHAFGVHWIERHFLQLGYRTETEQILPPVHHRIDLVARKNDDLIAVEYETGASRMGWNMEQCLATRATQIVIVFQEDKQRKQFLKQIADATSIAEAIRQERLILESLWFYLQQQGTSPQ